MHLKLFYNKSVHENAAYYYELAKESRQKIAGLEEALKQTEKEIAKAEKPRKKEVKIKRQKEWHEKFHSAFTSEGKLMIGGRNAQQNDMAFSKYMEDNDLFFHADIQGASVVILKDGLSASEQEMKEAAQFAASFSKAWANGNASVDVYAVEKKQLSKHATGGFVPTGAFAIKGERKWFRAARLALRIGLDDTVKIIPDLSKAKLKDELVLVPARAGKEKGSVAKALAKRFKVHPDELLEKLPNGKSRTIQK